MSLYVINDFDSVWASTSNLHEAIDIAWKRYKSLDKGLREFTTVTVHSVWGQYAENPGTPCVYVYDWQAAVKELNGGTL